MNQTPAYRFTLDGTTLLHNAASECAAETVAFLIGKGSDCSAADDSGNTPLPSFFGQGLFSESDSMKVLALIRELIKSGSDASRLNRKDETTLMLWAEASGSDLLDEQTAELILRALLACEGVDPAHRDCNGNTVWHRLATKETGARLAHMLVRHGNPSTFGPSVERTDKSGRTPLHVAVYRGNVEMMETLLAYGASARITADDKFATLHYAAAAAKITLVPLRRFLPSPTLSLKPSSPDTSPLHTCIGAITNSHAALPPGVPDRLRECIKLLEPYSVTLADVDAFGRTPLDIAASWIVDYSDHSRSACLPCSQRRQCFAVLVEMARQCIGNSRPFREVLSIFTEGLPRQPWLDEDQRRCRTCCESLMLCEGLYPPEDAFRPLEEESLFSAAISPGQKDLVLHLLSQGVDVDRSWEIGATPLELCVRFSSSRTIVRKAVGLSKRLHSLSSSGMTLVQLAVLAARDNGHTTALEVLLASAAPMDLTSKAYPWTPTMHSAKLSNPAAFRILLDRGADVMRSTPDGANALTRACGRGSIKIIELLLSKGVPFSYTEANYSWIPAGKKAYFGPLQIAAQNNRIKFWSYFLT
jgi:ankyrin repeat protein